MDGEAGWWTTSGNIGLPPLARVMGVGRQQKHPTLFVLSVCAYGGVVGYFWCFSILCEFCSLYCDDVRLGDVYEVFSSSILFLMPFMFI